MYVILIESLLSKMQNDQSFWILVILVATALELLIQPSFSKTNAAIIVPEGFHFQKFY